MWLDITANALGFFVFIVVCFVIIVKVAQNSSPDNYGRYESIEREGREQLVSISPPNLSESAAYRRSNIYHAFDAPKEAAQEKRYCAGVDAFEGKNTPDYKFYESVLGDHNRVYYLMRFARFDQHSDRLQTGWNWPAFLFSWVWAIYRKMYGLAFVLFVVWMVAVGVEVASQLQTISVGIMLIVKAVFAVYANAFYYRSVKEKISDIHTLTDNEPKQLEYLKSVGGVNVVGTVVALAVWVALMSVLQNILLH